MIIRDGILVGTTLLGDVSKVASLTQTFDRRVPLPEERIKLLFDIGAPPPDVGAAELADDAQVYNCNGVSKGQLVACGTGSAASAGSVATRAGKGCGSCKRLVADIVTAVLDDDLQTDPAEGYYVLCIPMDKSQLMTEIGNTCCTRRRWCSRTRTGRHRARGQQDGADFAAEDDVG